MRWGVGWPGWCANWTETIVDAQFMNPFILSIRNTFETMCGVEVAFAPLEMMDHEGEHVDVSGAIRFSGDAKGSVTLGFSRQVALRVATAFAQTEVEDPAFDLEDALGEMVNIIAGGAKSHFDGVNISISLPKVTVGRHQITGATRSAPHMLLPCRTKLGSFSVEVDMDIRRAK